MSAANTSSSAQDGLLIEHLVPRRKAASKASANFAEQLGSSSEDEMTPVKGTSKVKYGRQRARKSTDGSSRLKERPSKATLEPEKPPPSTASNQRPRPRPKSSRKIKDDLPIELEGQSTLPRVTTSLSASTKFLPPKKRELPQSDPASSSDDSVLTSISTSSIRPNNPASSFHRPRNNMSTPSAGNDDGWEIQQLGLWVWVLIDKRARVFEPPDAKRFERIWWPGKVISDHATEIPLKVVLYGREDGNNAGTQTVELHKPSAQNILPLRNSLGKARFDSSNAALSVPSGSGSVKAKGLASPTKKQRKDTSGIEDGWQDALAIAMAVMEDEDELPEAGLAYNVGSLYASASINSIWTEKDIDDAKEDMDVDSDDRRELSPPLPDDDLRIPGELVLAVDLKTRQSRSFYWPAKILEFVVSRRPTGKSKARAWEGLYRLKYVDETVQEVPRHVFFTSDQDEFGTCKMGSWESQFQDVVNDTLDEEHTDSGDDSDLERRHISSLVPADPPPSHEDFVDLTIQEQFAYTKPILIAILNEAYEPAKKKHDMFMRGGKARDSVVKEAGDRGKMDPKDVGRLVKCVRRWCLDGERGTINVDEDCATTQTPKTAEASIQRAVPIDSRDINVISVRSSPSPLSEIIDRHGPYSYPRHRERSSSPREDPPSSSFPVSAASPMEAVDEDGITSQFPREDMNLDSRLDKTQDTVRRSTSPLLNATERNLTHSLPVSSDVPDPDKEDLGTVSVSEHSEKANRNAVVRDVNSHSSAERDQEQGQDGQNIFPLVIPRQTRCEAYEALVGFEKADYCLNVLVPECILQILLWRSGERRSVDLLAPEEEMVLHKAGEALLKETDWVFDVVRLRAAKVRQLEKHSKKQPSKPSSSAMTGGTRSRPQRVLVQGSR